MNQRIKQLWLKALRSGRYIQAHCVLHHPVGGHCCLGVLECIISPETVKSSLENGAGGLSATILHEAGLTQGDQDALGVLNDSDGLTFPEIALCIEHDL